MEAGGEGPGHPAAQRLTNISGTDFLPAWSPDGTKIAFVSGRDADLEIYTMNANGSNPLRRTNSAGNDEYAGLVAG